MSKLVHLTGAYDGRPAVFHADHIRCIEKAPWTKGGDCSHVHVKGSDNPILVRQPPEEAVRLWEEALTK